MGRGLGLVELGNKAEMTSWGWSLGLNGALKTFPVGWGGVGWGWGKAGNKAKAQLQLGLGLS